MCKHEFVGDAKGVKCALCGKRLTAKEYGESLRKPDLTIETPKEQAKPKTTRTTKPAKTKK